MKELISVVVPMYFEEEVALECYNRLKKVMDDNQINYEFVFVNDGSTDKTMDILKKLLQRIIVQKLLILQGILGIKMLLLQG